jgi:hypothetical protein
MAQCKMKSENRKTEKEKDDLSELLLDFAAEIIKLAV